jgi:hypothetical protein
MTKCPFKVGEYVVLKTGTAPQQVTELAYNSFGWFLRARYTRYFTDIEKCAGRWRTVNDFEHYPGDPALHDYDTKKATPMAQCPKIYQTPEATPRYGTLLAINSVGQLVLEIKTGTGVYVEAFDKDKVEEVKPYTILCTDHEGRERHFTTTKDKVKENDILLSEKGLLFVTKINTGYAGNAPELKGRRVLTEEL